MNAEVNRMSSILHHRFRYREEITTHAFYRLLFNSGFLALVFLVLLLISMIFLSRPVW